MLIVALAGLLPFTACKKDPTPDPPFYHTYGWTAGSPDTDYGAILFTANGGADWQRQGTADVIPNVMINFISAVDDQLVWACGDSINDKATLLKTKNGGSDWVLIPASPDIPVTSYAAIAGFGSDRVWALGTGGIILYSSNAGDDWVQQGQGINPMLQFQSICVVDQNHVWAVGTVDTETEKSPYVYYTRDGGGSWNRMGEGAFDPVVTGFIDVHAIDSNYCWVVGTASSAYVTEDGGQTWQSMMVPGALAHNNGVCIVDKECTWLATDYSTANLNVGVKDEWSSFHLPTSNGAIWPVTIGVTVMNRDTLWMVTSAGGTEVNGEVFFTQNGGADWVKQDIPVISSFRRITFPKAMR